MSDRRKDLPGLVWDEDKDGYVVKSPMVRRLAGYLFLAFLFLIANVVLGTVGSMIVGFLSGWFTFSGRVVDLLAGWALVGVYFTWQHFKKGDK